MNEECLGPFLTDETGSYHHPYTLNQDAAIAIKAYCDESIAADYLFTVPTLTPNSLIALIILLFVAGGWALHFRRTT